MNLDNIIRVGWDIDGVLANFIKGYTEVMQNYYPNVGVVEDDSILEHYDLTENFGKERAIKTWEHIHESPVFYRELDPYVDAVMDTSELINNDYIEPHFITAREHPNSPYHQTAHWLQRNGLRGQLHMSPNKGRRAQQLGLDLYIDNSGENIMDVKRKSFTEGYLLDKKYNEPWETLKKVDSVKQFNDIARHYVEMKNKGDNR